MLRRKKKIGGGGNKKKEKRKAAAAAAAALAAGNGTTGEEGADGEDGEKRHKEGGESDDEDEYMSSDDDEPKPWEIARARREMEREMERAAAQAGMSVDQHAVASAADSGAPVVANAAPENDEDDPDRTIPGPRYNVMSAVLRNTLYLYVQILVHSCTPADFCSTATAASLKPATASIPSPTSTPSASTSSTASPACARTACAFATLALTNPATDFACLQRCCGMARFGLRERRRFRFGGRGWLDV